ncbi:MAG TPA: hypothetical protein VK171_14130 [Fimbriimonas sp.]|nr:hypothetical protein [Fimbriimonas sp.]
MGLAVSPNIRRISSYNAGMNLTAPLLLALLSQGAEVKSPPAVEEHSLLANVKVGQVLNYSFSSTYEIGSANAKFSSLVRMTIESYEAGKSVVIKNEQSKSTMSFQGKDVASDNMVYTTTQKVTGEFVSIDPDPTPEQARFGNVMQMIVPSDKVKVGSKWNWTIKGTETTEGIGVKGNGEVLAFEEHMAVKCAKVKFVQMEVGGERPSRGTLIAWISLVDGFAMEVQADYVSVPFLLGRSMPMKAVNKRIVAG